MSALFKLAVVLAFGLAIGLTIHGPMSPAGVAGWARLDRVDGLIDRTLVRMRPKAADIPVDPASAARIDEELDYRIAQQIGSLQAWRAFLDVHANGAHAQSAQAEIDKLLPAVTASQPVVAQVPEVASPGVQVQGEAARPAPASPGNEAGALPHDETCDLDGICPRRLGAGAESDGLARLAAEAGSQTFRPRFASLIDSPTAPAPVAASPTPSARLGPDPGAKPRRTASARGTEVSSRSSAPGRQHPCGLRSECHWKDLLALFGWRPKHSGPFGQAFADARPRGLQGR